MGRRTGTGRELLWKPLIARTIARALDSRPFSDGNGVPGTYYVIKSSDATALGRRAYGPFWVLPSPGIVCVFPSDGDRKGHWGLYNVEGEYRLAFQTSKARGVG